jgi:hypothetical protein
MTKRLEEKGQKEMKQRKKNPQRLLLPLPLAPPASE